MHYVISDNCTVLSNLLVPLPEFRVKYVPDSRFLDCYHLSCQFGGHFKPNMKTFLGAAPVKQCFMELFLSDSTLSPSALLACESLAGDNADSEQCGKN